MQLRHNASQYEFDLLQASGFTGCERYVEWRRAGIGTGTVRRSADTVGGSDGTASDYSMVIFTEVTAISMLALLLFTTFIILSWLESLIDSLIMSFCHYVVERATWSELMHMIMRE